MNSPLFPILAIVFCFIVFTQAVIHFIKSVAAVSSYLIAKCATMDEHFVSDFFSGVYAV